MSQWLICSWLRVWSVFNASKLRKSAWTVSLVSWWLLVGLSCISWWLAGHQFRCYHMVQWIVCSSILSMQLSSEKDSCSSCRKVFWKGQLQEQLRRGRNHWDGAVYLEQILHFDPLCPDWAARLKSDFCLLIYAEIDLKKEKLPAMKQLYGLLWSAYWVPNCNDNVSFNSCFKCIWIKSSWTIFS